jgi:hypothetical protein
MRAVLLVCLALVVPRGSAQTADVPFVVTPMNVVEAMLDLAKVGPQDYVIDLGSGDGRIVIMAAKKYGARGMGVELDGALVNDARRESQRQGVQSRVEFRAENLFITDLAPATVLTTYLYPRLNIQLTPRIFEQLKPGSRVVSHEFDFGNWKPDAKVTVKVPNKPYGPPQSDVLLWIVPANAAGRWQWRARDVQFEATLEQRFQELTGTASVGGKPAKIEHMSLRGDEIRLSVAGQELAGRISGDTIRGKEWQATRVARGRMNID